MLLISEINLKDNEREEAHPGLRCTPLHAVPKVWWALRWQSNILQKQVDKKTKIIIPIHKSRVVKSRVVNPLVLLADISNCELQSLFFWCCLPLLYGKLEEESQTFSAALYSTLYMLLVIYIASSRSLSLYTANIFHASHLFYTCTCALMHTLNLSMLLAHLVR